MKPGRELDALIAEKVMGWTREPEIEAAKAGYGLDIFSFAPLYSTDIAAAWEVAEKIKERGPGQFQIVWREGDDEQGWRAGWMRCDTWHYDAIAETAPHAVSLAALNLLNPS